MNSTGNSNISNDDGGIEKCLIAFVIRSEPTSSYIKNSIAVCILNVLLAIAGTILNGMVLFIFWKSAILRAKMSNFTIMILSITDLVVVTTVHPLFVFQRINELLETSKCQYVEAFYFAGSLLSGISAWTLFVINAERYLAIVYPIWHHVKVTKKRFVLICVIFWFIYCLNMISALSFYSHHANIVFCFSLAIMCFTSIFFYLSIFCIAKKKMSAIVNKDSSVHKTDTTRKLHQDSNVSKTDTSGKLRQDSNLHKTDTTGKLRGESSVSRTGTTKKFQVFLNELKTAKMYVIIVFISFVSYLPAGVVFAVENPESKTASRERNSIAKAYPWLLTICSISSTLNSLVFFWGNKKLKREGYKIFAGYFK